MKMITLFISHSGVDKDAFVRPLAEALTSAGYNVWYDEYELTVGDHLREKIDEGLKKANFGIVVLSESFFAGHWPTRELEGLFAINKKGQKLILPVWLGVTKDQVAAYSPMLANVLAAQGNHGVAAVVSELNSAITASNHIRETKVESKGLGPLWDVSNAIAAKENTRRFFSSAEGIESISQSATEITNTILLQVSSANSGQSAALFVVSQHQFDAMTVRGPNSLLLQTTLKEIYVNTAERAQFYARIGQGSVFHPHPSNIEILDELTFIPKAVHASAIKWEFECSSKTLSPIEVAALIIDRFAMKVKQALE